MKDIVKKAWLRASELGAGSGEETRGGDEGGVDVSDLHVDLSAAGVTRSLVLVALVLVALSFGAGILGLTVGPFVRLFAVGSDLSLPSWYSALVLMLASILLAAIAFAVKASEIPRYARRWGILGAIFAYLSCDEMLRLHERMAETLLRPVLEGIGFVPGGILYYPWVIVYAPLVAVFALAYFGFWRALPTRIRRLFLAAAAIFVGGAMGVELFNAYHDDAGGREPLVFVGTHVEEILEMLGVIVFVYALLSFIATHLKIAALRVSFR